MSSEIQTEGPEFVTVARVGEIEEGIGQPFEVGGRVIAVFLENGVYRAIDDACPHKGAPLCDGFVEEGAVICSWHGWRIRLADGCWTDNTKIRVNTYPVRVVDDAIQVRVG